MDKRKYRPMLFDCMKNYSSKQLIHDIVAGIIVAIIALPLSIALALASGVGPEEGIFTAITAGFLISFFGGSKVQIAGPTAAFATIVAGIVATSGMDGLITATIIAGVLLILMGFFKVGDLIKYIPTTITVGFTAGIAVTIVVGQLKDFMGITFPEGLKPIDTFEKLEAVFRNIATINVYSVLVGLVCLLILFLWPKISERVPSSLVAVIIGILMVKGMNLPVNTIGDLYTIKGGLPELHIPQITTRLIVEQFSNGATIAILAAIESLLSCVVADGMINSRHRSNQELIAQGIGNIGSAIFGGIPATGAIARTAANIKNGGKTPISGMVHALVLLIILLVLMPYAALIPMPSIAAILFQVAYNMSGWRNFLRICRRAPKSDTIVLLATFVLTIVFDLVVAIEFGMLATTVLFMKRMAEESQIKGWEYFDEDDPEATDLKIVPKYVRVYEITGPLFFGITDQIGDITIKEFTRYLIIRMRGVPAVDASAMQALEELRKHCQKNKVTLIFSHVNEQPYSAFKKSGFVKRVGKYNFCESIDAAIERAEKLETKRLILEPTKKDIKEMEKEEKREKKEELKKNRE